MTSWYIQMLNLFWQMEVTKKPISETRGEINAMYKMNIKADM